MLSLRYHRQYLWVFFMMFMVLVCVALAIDCCYVGSGGGSSGSFQLKTPRFMNVACVGIFSAISVVVQHALSRSIIKPDILVGDRRKWYKKNIKVTKKKAKKVANKRRHTEFMFASMMCNVINLIPVIVLYGLWAGNVSGVSDSMKFENLTSRTILAPEFFIPAVFIKYFAWYVNGFCAWCGLFRKNPRRNVMLASPLNI